MVKRNTDYKQVYLVDSFYLKHFNQQNQSFQNATSNTQQISLTTPKTNQYFSNHYSIPPSTLNKYSYNNFQNLVQPFDNQSKNSNTSNVQNSEYNFTNKPDKKFSQDHDDDYEPDPPEPFLYSDNDFQNIAKQPKDTNSNDNISTLESFPYYENFQNMNQQLIDSDRRNGDSVFNLNKKDILNKTKKQFYSCYICKRNFSSILLLEKHTKMKHNKYHNSNVENTNRNVVIENTSNINQNDDAATVEESTQNSRSSSQHVVAENEHVDIPESQPTQNSSANVNNDDDDDNDWIDIPDVQPRQTNVNHTNPQITVRKDTQTNFPNSINITKRKKQNDNIEKFYTYKCRECFMEFKNFDGLKEHQLQSHGKVGGMKRSITSNMQGLINETQKVEELNSYWCSACGKFLQNFASMKAHLEKEHQNAPIRAKRSKMNDKVKRKKVLYYTKY